MTCTTRAPCSGSDAELVDVALRDVLEGCVPGCVPSDVSVVDSSVLRFKGRDQVRAGDGVVVTQDEGRRLG